MAATVLQPVGPSSPSSSSHLHFHPQPPLLPPPNALLTTRNGVELHPLGVSRLRLPRYNLLLLTAILSTTAAIILFALRDGHRRHVDRFPYSSLPPSTCDAALPTTSQIPNIVHYVWLTRDPLLFTLDFRAFPTIYSSHLSLRPTAIYIHTDAAPSALTEPQTSGRAASWL